MFAGIIGAQVGSAVGSALGALGGEETWGSHGRCVGWTALVATALVGTPSGRVRFGNKRPRFAPQTAEPADAREPVKVAGPLKSLLVAPLLGAFTGLILGGVIGGYVIAVYFFAALSPLGPGGWWPVLPLAFRATSGGFTASSPWWMIPWLIVVGAFVLAGATLGLVCTTTIGDRTYKVFPGRGADEK